MTLLRNDSTVSKDTAPATASSLGSRVFRTFSSASSGGRNNSEVNKAVQAANAAAAAAAAAAGAGAGAAPGAGQQKNSVVLASVPAADKSRSSMDMLHSQAKRMTFGRPDKGVAQAAPAAEAAAEAAAPSAQGALPVQSSSARAAPHGAAQQQQSLPAAPSTRAAQAQHLAAAKLKSLDEEKSRSGQQQQQQQQGGVEGRVRQAAREAEASSAPPPEQQRGNKKYSTRRLAEARARGQARAKAEKEKAEKEKLARAAEKAEKEKLARAAEERVRQEERAFVEAYSQSAAAEREQQAVALKSRRAEAEKAAAQANLAAKTREAEQTAQLVAEAATRAQERQRQEPSNAEAEARRRLLQPPESQTKEGRRRASSGAEQVKSPPAAAMTENAGARTEAETRRLRAEQEAKRARERRDREREEKLENERKERERKELERKRQQQERVDREMQDRRERERRAKEEQEKAKASPRASPASAVDPFVSSSSTANVGLRPLKAQAPLGAAPVKRGNGPANSFFAVSPVEGGLRSPSEVAVEASPEAAPPTAVAAVAAATANGRGASDPAFVRGKAAAADPAAGQAERAETSRSIQHVPTNGEVASNAAAAAAAAAAPHAVTTAAAVAGSTEVSDVADKMETLEVSIPPSQGAVAAKLEGEEEASTALEEPPPPLTQMERDENILRAHLASWRFCFHEAAALLTPVLGAGCVETPNGGGDSGQVTAPSGGGFAVGASEEVDLHSELWAKLVQAEALMLQTMLSVSSGANKDTLAACEAVTEALELSLPKNREAVREEVAFKLAGAAEVARSVGFPVVASGCRRGVSCCIYQKKTTCGHNAQIVFLLCRRRCSAAAVEHDTKVTKVDVRWVSSGC